MGKRTDDLFAEILKNARKDRETIEGVRKKIVELSASPEIQAEQMALVGIAENVAKLSDVLTKINAQLVELTKVSVRSERPDDPGKENDSIFDEIESSVEPSGTIEKEDDLN